MDSYCGEAFERLCREALPLLYDAEKVSGKFEVGEFWGRQVQIDVVGCAATAGSISENANGMGGAPCPPWCAKSKRATLSIQ